MGFSALALVGRRFDRALLLLRGGQLLLVGLHLRGGELALLGLGVGNGLPLALVALGLHGDHFAGAGVAVHAESRAREVRGGVRFRETIGLHFAVLGQQVAALACDVLAELAHLVACSNEFGIGLGGLFSLGPGGGFGRGLVAGLRHLRGREGRFGVAAAAAGQEGRCGQCHQGNRFFDELHVSFSSLKNTLFTNPSDTPVPL